MTKETKFLVRVNTGDTKVVSEKEIEELAKSIEYSVLDVYF